MIPRRPIRGITVTPEVAYSIAALDCDVIEGADRPPAGLVGGYLAIHAGALYGGRDSGCWPGDWASMLAAAARAGWSVDRHPPRRRGRHRWVGGHVNAAPPRLTLGHPDHGARELDPPGVPTRAIVAIARLENMTAAPASRWSTAAASGHSLIALELADVVALPMPVSLERGGRRGFWILQPAEVDTLRRAWIGYRDRYGVRLPAPPPHSPAAMAADQTPGRGEE